MNQRAQDPGDQIVPRTTRADPNQAGLFDAPAPRPKAAFARSTDPYTSKEAAQRVDVTKREAQAGEPAESILR